MIRNQLLTYILPSNEINVLITHTHPSFCGIGRAVCVNGLCKVKQAVLTGVLLILITLPSGKLD